MFMLKNVNCSTMKMQYCQMLETKFTKLQTVLNTVCNSKLCSKLNVKKTHFVLFVISISR